MLRPELGRGGRQGSFPTWNGYFTLQPPNDSIFLNSTRGYPIVFYDRTGLIWAQFCHIILYGAD